MGISVLIAADSLELLPVIRVDITVVEMSKDASRTIGIQWPESAQFQVLPDRITTSDSLQATLYAMESRGEVKMLASPNLICRSGKEAEFLAGGEVPIKVSNYKVHEVIWRKYGVLLKIKPVADSTGRISLSIETEVSSLSDLSPDGTPSIKTNRVSSQFDLSHPRVVALSGLLKESERNKADGVAFLSKIPILGSLFSSQNFQSNKSELVIFVHPRLMDQVSPEEWTKGASHANTSL
jgi:pilus assembly protein CpaC